MDDQQEFNAWNPGMRGVVPPEHENLFTYFNPENVDTSRKDAFELSDFCGLKLLDVVSVKPERLLLHEAFLRTMVRVHIDDGDNYLVFGKRFRELTKNIMDEAVAPRMDEFKQKHDALRDDISNTIKKLLEETYFPQPKAHEELKKTGISAFFSSIASWKKGDAPKTPDVSVGDSNHVAIFRQRAAEESDEKMKSVYKNLATVCEGVGTRFGRMVHNPDVVNKIATNMVCNEYGSYMLGQELEPDVDAIVQSLGLRSVPMAQKSIIISLKGASASGKSSFRTSLSKGMTDYMQDCGLDDLSDFAMISPDVCRKMMIDYDSLGDAYKYAGMLTAEELQVIDQKVDRYLRETYNQNNALPNMLIDRFRFDTFSAEENERVFNFVSKADALHMCFIVTDPAEIVERGYNRGLETGRYRSVDDFLALSIEAHKGIPSKFMQWLKRDEPEFRYEFFNNNVPKGEPQDLVAYGDRHSMRIYDVSTLLDIERYRKVNINAKTLNDLYLDKKALEPSENVGFLKSCVAGIDQIEFADPQSDIVFAISSKGSLKVTDASLFAEKLQDEDFFAVMREIDAQAVTQFQMGSDLDI